MTLDAAKFAKVVEEAKSKTTNSRWISAIDKAADALINGKWIITELAHGIAVTTESGETYFANGACQCKAFTLGQACKHRAAARLIELYRQVERSAPRITRTTESERTGVRFEVVRCDGWAI